MIDTGALVGAPPTSVTSSVTAPPAPDCKANIPPVLESLSGMFRLGAPCAATPASPTPFRDRSASPKGRSEGDPHKTFHDDALVLLWALRGLTLGPYVRRALFSQEARKVRERFLRQVRSALDSFCALVSDFVFGFGLLVTAGAGGARLPLPVKLAPAGAPNTGAMGNSPRQVSPLHELTADWAKPPFARAS